MPAPAAVAAKGRSVGLATLGVMIALVGGLIALETWPESTTTTGDCVLDVQCPPLTITDGSAALALAGCILGLIGLLVVLVALKRRSAPRAR